MADNSDLRHLGPIFVKSYNEDLWNEDIAEDSPKEHLINYIGLYILESDPNGLAQNGADAHRDFKEFFSEWSVEMWKKVPKTAKLTLKNEAQRRGLPIHGDDLSIAVFKCATMPTIVDHREDKGKEQEPQQFYQRNPQHYQEPHQRAPQHQQEPHQTYRNPQQSPPPVQFKQVRQQHQTQPQGRSGFTREPTVGTTTGFFPPNSARGNYPAHQHFRCKDPDEPYDQYSTLPPRDVAMVDTDCVAITTFVTIWGSKEKYDGKLYNLLDIKLRPFFNICRQMRIELPGFHSLFPSILTGQAEDYYLRYLTNCVSFREIYDGLQSHFEHNVNLAQYHIDWNIRWSHRLADRKKSETKMDLPNQMLDKLMLCQQALGNVGAGEGTLCQHVRQAITGHQEFEYALQCPGATCEIFFGQLRSSLATVTARVPSSTGMFPQACNIVHWDDDEDPALVHYIERKYGRPQKALD